mmetsp:Transcript_19722/g.47805  ORF Transcript_19722/g.47805 Transcript_19722/m.47805 type:complete len:231 (-) Transcript_19722:615-1307(-)
MMSVKGNTSSASSRPAMNDEPYSDLSSNAAIGAKSRSPTSPTSGRPNEKSPARSMASENTSLTHWLSGTSLRGPRNDRSRAGGVRLMVRGGGLRGKPSSCSTATREIATNGDRRAGLIVSLRLATICATSASNTCSRLNRPPYPSASARRHLTPPGITDDAPPVITPRHGATKKHPRPCPVMILVRMRDGGMGSGHLGADRCRHAAVLLRRRRPPTRWCVGSLLMSEDRR